MAANIGRRNPRGIPVLERQPDAIQEPNRWEAAVRYATLAQETDDSEEREHYTRLRDAWITLGKRCEPFIPDVRDSEN
jgi:hypothetical protein